MKKSIRYALIFLFTANIMIFSSCKQNTPANSDDVTTESDTAENDTYKIDLSGLTPWDKSDSFDAKTGKLSAKNGWGAGIGFASLDISKYKYLEIKYREPASHFEVKIEYNDKSESKSFCKKRANVAYVALNGNKVNYISISKGQSDFSVFFDSMTFVGKKPEESSQNKKPVVDKKSGSFNSSISALDLAKEMKVGWNLAGSLDADVSLGRQNASTESLDFIRSLGTETEECWGNKPYTTKEIINFPKSNGYSSIRIPVTWYNHIIDDNYTIDSEWMARVKEVVDWAMEAGYYVILDSHHDVAEYIVSPLRKTNGYVVKNEATDIAESKRFIKAIWTQISTAFNGSYDEHLIFETLNEPRNVQHEHQWSASYWGSYCDECKADYKILNEYNQLCLDTKRASGGNNANRFVMVPGLATGDQTPLLDLFKMPQDTATDKLLLTVHNYILGCEPKPEITKFTSTHQQELESTFSKLIEKFVKNGIPVVIGETSANRLQLPKSERINWITYFSGLTSGYGMPLIYWDIPEDSGYSLDQFDRKNLKFIEPDFVQAMLDNWECE